jgi:AcrR family transcriptional regulator
MGAMVDAVARNGYPATTLRELVSLAGVSNTTFYEHFGSKQECFLATSDAIVARTSERTARAYRSESGYREGLRAALMSFADFVAEEPAATSLVLLDSLSLGAVGVTHRQQASEAFELLIRQSAAQAPERGELSDLTIRAIVGGIRRVVNRALRSGQAEQLRNHVEEILDWGLSYQRPGGASSLELPTGQPMSPAAKIVVSTDDEEVWDERPDTIRNRSTLTQRERMVRAAAMVVAERGYEKLSIPAITAAAGVSNQTFYEHFSGKQEAFLEAIDTQGRRAVARIAPVIGANWAWPDAIIAGLRELLSSLAETPLLARLPFIEVLAAGPSALGRVDAVLDGLTSLFGPGAVPAEVGPPLPEIVVEAICGGIFVVIQHEIAQGRTETLPELLPEITFIALAPSLATSS